MSSDNKELGHPKHLPHRARHKSLSSPASYDPDRVASQHPQALEAAAALNAADRQMGRDGLQEASGNLQRLPAAERAVAVGLVVASGSSLGQDIQGVGRRIRGDKADRQSSNGLAGCARLTIVGVFGKASPNGRPPKITP